MKKYLNTPEEVIKALNDGKKVKSDDDYYLKMIDGVICSFSDTGWIVGTNVSENENPYIEEAEPLELKVGKNYRTDTGRKVVCVHKTNKHFVFAVIGTSVFDSSICGSLRALCFTTDLTGQSNNIEHTKIIGEWED